jgi:hypothetical protein
MRVIGVKHLLKGDWMHCLQRAFPRTNQTLARVPLRVLARVCEERLARVSNQTLARIIEETQNQKSR